MEAAAKIVNFILFSPEDVSRLELNARWRGFRRGTKKPLKAAAYIALHGR
jgi:hypothetical protein